MTKVLKIPYDSQEYAYIGIVCDTDPTTLMVQVALAPAESDVAPLAGEFANAAWMPNGPFITEVNDKYQKAQIVQALVSSVDGDGVVQWSTPGDYAVWVKFSDGTQNVVRKAGKIQVT